MPRKLLQLAFGMAGLVWALRLCWACVASGREDFSTASRWWPRHAGFVRNLAALDAAHEKGYLEKALALAPQSAPVMVSLALIAESAGDQAAASAWFQRAAAADRRYRTTWAHLNFLFRSQMGGETAGPAFWRTAEQAFEMSHRNREALLDLCWSRGPDPARLIAVAGERPPVLWDLTRFLMDQNEVAGAVSTYQKLLTRPYLTAAHSNAGRVASREERWALGLDLVDWALHRRDRNRAWTAWQSMMDSGLLSKDAARSAAAQWGEVQRGFDWHRKVDGIEREADGWTLRLGDRTDGESTILWRYAPPGMAGQFAMDVSGDPGGTIRWRQADGRIEVFYYRLPGKVAPPGDVTFRNLRWEARP